MLSMSWTLLLTSLGRLGLLPIHLALFAPMPCQSLGLASMSSAKVASRGGKGRSEVVCYYRSSSQSGPADPNFAVNTKTKNPICYIRVLSLSDTLPTMQTYTIQTLYFPNMARNDRLFPSFCTLSAFRSIALFCVGIAGKTGLCNIGFGLATLLTGTDDIPFLNGRSFGFFCACLRSFPFGGKAVKPVLGAFWFPAAFCRFSICPSIVVPLKARSSSGIRVKRMMPRTGATPNASAR